MERVVYQQMAELDQRHWWYRARRTVLADLIRREVDAAGQRPDSSRSAAALGTISRCFRLSGRLTRSSSTKKREPSPRDALAAR